MKTLKEIDLLKPTEDILSNVSVSCNYKLYGYTEKDIYDINCVNLRNIAVKYKKRLLKSYEGYNNAMKIIDISKAKEQAGYYEKQLLEDKEKYKNALKLLEKYKLTGKL